MIQFQCTTDAQSWLEHHIPGSGGKCVTVKGGCVVVCSGYHKWAASSRRNSQVVPKVIIGSREDVIAWAAVELTVIPREMNA